MNNKHLLALSIAGLLVTWYAVYLLVDMKAVRPLNPAPSPYPDGIYAEGIVEGDGTSGKNIRIYSEVDGAIEQIYVRAGQAVRKGTPMFLIDESVRRAAARLNRYRAMRRAYSASSAFAGKYLLRAPQDGTVVGIDTVVGAYVSPQGSGTDPRRADPLLILGSPSAELDVSCYVDEVLLSRLPSQDRIKARLFIHGTNMEIPLSLRGVQSQVSSETEASGQHRQKATVREVPLIFHLEKPEKMLLYPGELVDIYISR